jgi:toxin HigB-1
LAIRNFRDKATAAFFASGRTRAGWQSVAAIAARKLDMLDAAVTLDDLKQPPGNVLEGLSGDRRGQHSIRVNQQWRICFVWTAAGPTDVEIVDYH